jgi:hypothetical protein
MNNFTKFETSYIEAMLWSSIDDIGEPLDSRFTISDLSDELIERIKLDCNFFISKADTLLDGIGYDQAGHDFWPTRNRHGAGFWDRGLSGVGDKLTTLSHGFGEVFIYESEGKLYAD